MAQFNFTVRATDSEGSFADRSFNITVRNSKIERFMAINTSDAYTSSDGTTWTLRPGMGGYSCAYGNGFWLINTSNGLRKSYDGVNYNFIPSASIVVNDETGSPIDQSHGGSLLLNSSFKIRSFGNKFYLACAGGNIGGTSQYGVFVSSDGITWNFKRATIGTITSGLQGFGIIISEDNGTLFINKPGTIGGNEIGYMSTDAGETWSPVLDVVGAIKNSGILKRYNGLYLTSNSTSTSNPSTYSYSTDGSNWVSGGFGLSGHLVRDFIYANGKLYAFFNRNGSGGAQAYMTSADGINWDAHTYRAFNNSVQYSTAAALTTIYKNGVFLISSPTGAGNHTDPDLSLDSGGLRLSTNGTDWSVVNRYDDTSTSFTDIAMM